MGRSLQLALPQVARSPPLSKKASVVIVKGQGNENKEQPAVAVKESLASSPVAATKANSAKDMTMAIGDQNNKDSLADDKGGCGGGCGKGTTTAPEKGKGVKIFFEGKIAHPVISKDTRNGKRYW